MPSNMTELEGTQVLKWIMSALCESTICRAESLGGPRETPHVICDSCARHFASNLEAIAAAYDDVAAAIGGTSSYVIKEFTAAGGTMETGLVINEAASKTRADIEGFTRWLVGTVLETKPTTRPPSGTVPERLRWVVRWHTTVFTVKLDRDRIIEAATSAKTAAHAARRAAYPSGDRWLPLPGTCRHDIDGEHCGAELAAVIRKDTSFRPSAIQCVNDQGHSIPSTEWVKYGRQLMAAA